MSVAVKTVTVVEFPAQITSHSHNVRLTVGPQTYYCITGRLKCIDKYSSAVICKSEIKNPDLLLHTLIMCWMIEYKVPS